MLGTTWATVIFVVGLWSLLIALSVAVRWLSWRLHDWLIGALMRKEMARLDRYAAWNRARGFRA